METPNTGSYNIVRREGKPDTDGHENGTSARCSVLGLTPEVVIQCLVTQIIYSTPLIPNRGWLL